MRFILRSRHSVIALICMCAIISPVAARAATNAPIIGEIQQITLNDPADHFTGGVIVVGGQNVIVPRNLLVDLPANRLTLRQLFSEAPPNCEIVSGLAKPDSCAHGTGAIATINANRLANGDVIAGEVFIAKGVETVSGVVSFINYADGYFRVNGVTGSDTTGVMVRINDPEGRHTIQQGAGCAVGPNCSPDRRFGVDTDNYTASFMTGYPTCIPSTQVGGARGIGANAFGVGDPFCPDTNRSADPVPDATRFAPLRVGDHVLGEGNFEIVGGVRFLSVWHFEVHLGLTTREEPTQPDYLSILESGWDAPGFQNERARFLLIGTSTLPDSQLDVFALHIDPTTNVENEVPLASTVGNPGTTGIGVVGRGGIWKIRYDVDFIAGVTPLLSPCTNLRNASLPGCPGLPSLADEMSVLSPISRELIIHTRRRSPLLPGIKTLDINGNEATHSRYLSPVTVVHAEAVEFNLDAIQTPFNFDGLPWVMDRRLGPSGCEGPCPSTPTPLEPFPSGEVDPRTTSANPVPQRMFAFYPFGPTDLLAWPPPVSPAVGITPTPDLPLLCAATTTPPPAPSVTSVTPANGLAGTGTVVSIQGTNFVPGAECSFGAGITAACTVTSSLEMTGVLAIDAGASDGPRTLTVTTAGGTAVLANAFTVVVSPTAAAPFLLSSVIPGSGLAGQTLDLTIQGSNYLPGVTCDLGPNITVVSCNAVSSTEIIARVTLDPAALSGMQSLIVTNPPGYTASLTNAFEIVSFLPPPPPEMTLTAVTSSTIETGASMVLTINGTGFVPDSACSFGAGIAVAACQFVTPTTIIAGIAVDSNAVPGFRDVTVVTPDLRTAALPAGLSIVGPTLPPEPPTPTSTLFADDFDALDANTLGPLWNTVGRWYRKAGKARGESAATTALVRMPLASDQYVQVRLKYEGGDKSGVVARAQGTSYYAARMLGAGKVQVIRVDGGTETILGEVNAPFTLTAFHSVRLTVSGSSPVRLDAMLDGTNVLTVMDSSSQRLLDGRAGMLSGANARTQYDNFRILAP